MGRGRGVDRGGRGRVRGSQVCSVGAGGRRTWVRRPRGGGVRTPPTVANTRMRVSPCNTKLFITLAAASRFFKVGKGGTGLNGKGGRTPLQEDTARAAYDPLVWRIGGGWLVDVA